MAIGFEAPVSGEILRLDEDTNRWTRVHVAERRDGFTVVDRRRVKAEVGDDAAKGKPFAATA